MKVLEGIVTMFADDYRETSDGKIRDEIRKITYNYIFQQCGNDNKARLHYIGCFERAVRK